MCTRIVTFLAGATLLAPAALRAQSLAERVNATPANAVVRFTFPSKPGVCGDGTNIRVGRDDAERDRDARRNRMRECTEGPVELELERSAGKVVDVEVRVGGESRPADVDLGMIDARAAVEYLLADATLLAARGDAADRLIFAATLADAESWPALLRIARATDHRSDTRRTAIFWLAQVAGDHATEGLRSIAGDASDEVEVRKHAIFAIAQLRTEAAIDALIDIARTNREPEIRRNAFFWLGQSGSPRAIEFFEEILRG